MKLYDFTRAPNPRRVRIFLAEKGITVPMEQVDLFTGVNRTPEAPQSLWRAAGPGIGSRHLHRRVDGDLPLFRGSAPPAGADGGRRQGPRRRRDVEPPHGAGSVRSYRPLFPAH